MAECQRASGLLLESSCSSSEAGTLMGAHSLTASVLGPIRPLAEAEHLTLVIGAGASVPSGLPNWTELVVRLLRRSFPGPDSDVMARRLITTQGLSLAAGAAIGKASKRNKMERVAKALYGDDRGTFVPSEMHRAVAELVAHRLQLGFATKVLTTNYDDLVEAALSETGIGFRRRHSADRPGGSGVMVEHLNGLLGLDGTDSEGLILTSADYVRELAQPARDWRMDTFAEGARSGPVMFVGTSLTDPLLMMYLDALGTAGGRRFVAFARQSFELPARLEARFEMALTRQWGQFGVQPIFGDDYADLALLIREITVVANAGYEPPNTRLRTAWLSLREEFADRQSVIEQQLSADISALVAHLGDEANLILWLADGKGDLVRFGGSHRVYTNDDKLRHIPYAHGTRWVITRALADGVDSVRVATLEPQETDLGTPSRRWRTVAAIAIPVAARMVPPITTGGLSAATIRTSDQVDHHAIDAGLRDLASAWRDRLESWID